MVDFSGGSLTEMEKKDHRERAAERVIERLAAGWGRKGGSVSGLCVDALSMRWGHQ